MAKSYTLDDIQKENLYLNAGRDSEIGLQILKYRDLRYRLAFEQRKYFDESIEEYDKYISFIAKLIKELRASLNPLVLCMVLRKLIFNGYFSIDKFVTVNSAKFYDIRYYEGMDVLVGKACCRHVVSFCDELFKKLEITSRPMPCIRTRDKKTLKEAFSNCCNHTLSLFSHDGVDYGYDIFDDVFLKSINGFQMREIFEYESDDYRLLNAYYKPSMDMMFYGIAYDNMMERIKKMGANSRKKVIDYINLMEFVCISDSIYHGNLGLLRDFKSESKGRAKKIADSILTDYTNYINSKNKKSNY